MPGAGSGDTRADAAVAADAAIRPSWRRSTARACARPRRCRSPPRRPPSCRGSGRGSARWNWLGSLASSNATRPAAAFSTTMSRTAPRSPANTSCTIAALCAASPPTRSSMLARGMPSSRGIEVVLLDRAAGDLPHVAVAGRRQLVESVVAAEDERGGAARLEHADDERHAVEVRDAHRGGLGAGRVAERAEEVEDGRHAELGAHRPRVPEAGVEGAREREGDAGLAEHLRHPLRGEGEVEAEGGEHVGRSRRRARGAVAVLDHGHAGCRGDDGGHGRHVHRAEPVAARADDVERHRVDGQRHGVLEHGVAEAHDLVDRLPLHAQRDEESGELGVRDGARHDLLHAPRRIRHAEIFAVEERGDDGRPGLCGGHAPILAIGFRADSRLPHTGG